MSGENVTDVTSVEAFAGVISSIATIYDLQHDSAYREILVHEVANIAGYSRALAVPENSHDLQRRQDAYELVARSTFGMLGRSPDFLNATVLGMAAGANFFASADEAFGRNISSYLSFLRDEDLFLTHALVPPSGSTKGDRPDQTLRLQLVRETDSGIIVSGAKKLATLGPIADEVLVYDVSKVSPGNERFQLCFAVPISTAGISQIARRPHAVCGGSSFDHPLSSRFEECDALMMFDRVLVPWERVFYCIRQPLSSPLDIVSSLTDQTDMFHHAMHQAATRGLVKLQLAVGIAIAIAQATGSDRDLHVQNMLGECLQYIEINRSCLTRAVAICERGSQIGSVRPHLPSLQTLRTVMPRFYARVIEIVQLLSGSESLTVPSAMDCIADIDSQVSKYLTGHSGPRALTQMKLYNLAWELVGDAFGGRQLQYERFYGGDPFRTTAAIYAHFDKTEEWTLVNAALTQKAPMQSRTVAGEALLR